MVRWPRNEMVRVAGACAGLAATTLGCGSQRPGSQSSSDSIAAFSQVIVCNTFTSLEDREIYALSAMNRKLLHFPDFAAQVEIESVSDCAGARSFMTSYRQYSAIHPGFDAHERHSPLPSIPDLPPQPPTEDGSEPKVFGGAPPTATLAQPHDPIVQITTSRNVHGLKGDSPESFCSGTFIAKNWIATAAHCLVDVDPLCNANISDPTCTLSAPIEKLFGYTNFTVGWVDQTGSMISAPGARVTRPGDNVLQIPDDLWLGSTGGEGTLDTSGGIGMFTFSGASEHDFALLYLNEHSWDPYLPPNGDDGAAMRLSANPPAIPAGCNAALPENCTQISFAGFGNSVIQTAQNRELLPTKLLAIGQGRVTQLGGSVTTTALDATGQPVSSKVTLDVSFVLASQNASDGVMCHGDSGGPVYRQVDIGGTKGVVPALLGVLSNGDPAGFAGTNCTRPGFNMFAARADIQVDSSKPDSDLVEATMRNWYGNNFSCQAISATGSQNKDLVQCWGKPCQNEADCGANATCRRPPSSVAQDAPAGVCPICQQLNLPTNATGCDCVFGQCVPLNSPFR
jgi:hypothetical protein